MRQLTKAAGAAAFGLWASQTAAFDYPQIEGADTSSYSLAIEGEIDAAAAYIMPLLQSSDLDDAQFEGFTAWMTHLYDTFVEMDHRYNTLWTAYQLAFKNVERQDFDEAADWVSDCVDRGQNFTAPDEQRLFAYCMFIGGDVFAGLARYDDALIWFQRARAEFLELYEADPDGGAAFSVAETYMSEGYSLSLLGRHDEAVEMREFAHGLFVEIEGEDAYGTTIAKLNLGTSLWYAGRHEEAYGWMQRALDNVDRYSGRYSYDASMARNNTALIAYDLGRADEAKELAISVLPFIATAPEASLDHQRWTFSLLRKIFADEGDVERAILFGKLAVNAQQEVRSRNAGFSDDDTAQLRERWNELYDDLAELMIAEGRFSEAQAVLNMQKEQEAFEFLKRDATATLNETEAVLTDQELSESAKLVALAAEPVAAYELLQAAMTRFDETGSIDDEDQVFLLEDALAEAQAAFREEVDAFLVDVVESERQGFQDQFDATGSYQAILRAKERPTAILQLALLDDATHIFLTLPGTTVHETVAVSKGEMRARVFEALQAMERLDPGVTDPLGDLYDLLIAPVREALEIAGTEVIMVNAGDVLRYVPFSALHDGEGYVVRDFAFAQYVAAVPTSFSRPERSRDSAAGFGVTQAHGTFSALPGVAEELETLFLASDGEGVLGGAALLDDAFDARALRRALRDPPELLHIASHFALLPGQVDDSFLLLGDGSELSMAELSTSRFNFAGVDLLTLSACQTAIGDRGDGSEIDGVGAAALKNGASAVMASLWPVADDATPLLMADFYEGLYGGGLDKAEALRQAQIAMLDSAGGTSLLAERAATLLEDSDDFDAAPVGFSHPYFWSAFILMGNWL